jgi:hypothetical protein
MKTVNYSIGGVNSSGLLDQTYELINFEPIPLLKYAKDKHEGSEFLSCPAFIDYVKNAFIVLAPCDLSINFDETSSRVRISPGANYSGEYNFKILYSKVKDRYNEKTGILTMTLPPSVFVWSDFHCMIESIPMMLDVETEISKKISIVPGTYDISRWFRPIDFTFQLHKDENSLLINRGDPLFCFRLTTECNDKVKLNRVKLEQKHIDLANATVGIKRIFSERKLSVLYELFDKFKYLSGVFKDKSCPFKR